MFYLTASSRTAPENNKMMRSEATVLLYLNSIATVENQLDLQKNKMDF